MDFQNSTDSENIENTNMNVVVVLNFLIAILIIVLNLPSAVVIFASFTKNLHLQSAHVLLGLSATDLIFGLFLLSFHILSYINSKFVVKECAVLVYGMLSTRFSSHCQILGIAVERFAAVRKKFPATPDERKKAAMTVIIVPWFVSIIFMSIIHHFSHHDEYNSSCRFFKFTKDVYVTVGIVSVAVQLLTWFFLCCIVYHLICYLKEVQIQTERSRHEVRTAVTFTIVAIVCTCLNAPYLVIQCSEALMEEVSQTVRTITSILSILICIVNPLLYLIRIRRLRNLMHRSLMHLLCKSPVTPVNAEIHGVANGRTPMVAIISEL